MSYVGDIALGETIYVPFTTRRFSTGAPFTLAGTPAVAAYVDAGTVEITAGITLGVDHDARTGLNMLTIVATSGNGYAAGTDVALVITAGTVDSVSVVGEVVGTFSIDNRSALRPTVAARTLDVSAGGEAGVDWANVGSPTTVVGLSGTTVKTATDVETDTADIQSRLGAPSNLGGGANLSQNLADIAGAGFVTTTDGLAANQAEHDATQASLVIIDDFIDTEVTQILADTDDIQLRIPAALTADGNMKADSLRISGSATAADNLEASALAIVVSSVNDAAATTTVFVTALTEATNDHYKGRIIIFTSGALAGQATDITAYNGTTKAVTVTALTEAPANGTAFVML